MAKEYKFMFDRRFDEPEEEEKEEASVPAEPAERNVPDDIPAPVPSISEILDTLSEQVPDLNLETPVSETPQEEENQPTETPAPPPPPPPPLRRLPALPKRKCKPLATPPLKKVIKKDWKKDVKALGTKPCSPSKNNRRILWKKSLLY